MHILNNNYTIFVQILKDKLHKDFLFNILNQYDMFVTQTGQFYSRSEPRGIKKQ